MECSLVTGNATGKVLPPAYSDVNKSARVLSCWKTWSEQGYPGLGEHRDLALRRMEACLEMRFSFLDLSQLSLFDLPTVWPDFIEELDLSGNKLRTLPDRLPANLDVLKVSCNCLMDLPATLPKGLMVLDVHKNQLKSLPILLPNTLQELIVAHNHLENLPELLPPYLVTIDASHNKLTELPTMFSRYLETLFVDHNHLNHLPESLPTGLHILCANHNELSALPYTLPNDLISLYVGNNALVQVPPNLPPNLEELYLCGNNIIKLPESLPDTLVVLNVSYNLLIGLPEKLPSRLTTLSASHNRLRYLPHSFPENLQTLFLGWNQLTKLPKTFPRDLEFVQLKGNPLPMIPQPLLCVSAPVSSVAVSNFMTVLHLWGNEWNAEFWKKIEQGEDGIVLSNFLKRLHQSQPALNSELKMRVSKWLHYLAKPENEGAWEMTFLLASEAFGMPVSRSSFYFNKIQCVMIENELIKNHLSMTPQQIIDAFVGLFRLEELEKIVGQQIEMQYRTPPNFNRDIQRYLDYQYHLKEFLVLPIHFESEFRPSTEPDGFEMITVAAQIGENEKQHFLRYLLMDSLAWEVIMKAWNKEKIEQAKQQYLDEIDSAEFQNTLISTLRERNVSINDKELRLMTSIELENKIWCKGRFEVFKAYLQDRLALSLISRFDSPLL